MLIVETPFPLIVLEQTMIEVSSARGSDAH